MTLDRRVLAAGSLLAASGVALGAFGTHGLRGMLDAREVGWWETAVSYQMWHAIGIAALAAMPLRRLGSVVLLLGAGTVIFSGSLYAMALTGWRWLGAVTPLGGSAMIAGWLLLAWHCRHGRSAR